MNFKLLLIAGVAITTSGCATIVKGSNQDVSFAAADASGDVVSGATCRATGGKDGAVNETFTTPAVVEIPRSNKNLMVSCTRGAMNGSETVNDDFEGWAIGNIVSWGLLGFGVDYLTDAMWKYPSDVLVDMAGGAADTTATMGDDSPMTDPMMP